MVTLAASSSAAELLALAANYLHERGRLDLAREVAAEALLADNNCANAHSIMHVVCDEIGKWIEGLSHARQATEMQPQSAQLRYNLALSTLRLDDYPSGFELMEARIDKPDWTGSQSPRAVRLNVTGCCGPACRWMANTSWWSASKGLATASCSRAICRCWRHAGRG
jgi:tetratricopeptide (TPR) repeat protein